MSKLIVALLLFLCPTPLVAPLLRWMGYRIGGGTRVGFSLLMADRISLGSGVRIGHLNLLRLRRVVCKDRSQIGRSNLVNGPLSLQLCEEAAFGNRNWVTRGASPSVVCWGASLRLGTGSKITSDHQVDCTRSVTLGEYGILAGSGSQVWTHGYVHSSQGPDRYRVDGSVTIGRNVYVGSRCIVNPGVVIAPGCIIGAGTVVSKSLPEQGLYVGAAARFLARPADPQERDDLIREPASNLCEAVFLKRR